MSKKELDTKIQEQTAQEQMEEQGIKVANPLELRPVELPLVVTLPEDASKAQIAYVKYLNSYAYQNPTKWEQKKEALLKKLASLKNAPDPITDSKLKINNSGI